MTGVISDDALQNQSNRIMKALRAATQQNSEGGDLRNIAASLTSQAQGGNYFDSMKKFSDQQTQRNIDAETGIYNQMKEQSARGNSEAKTIDDAISEVAGNDPKIYASILNDLHNDPEDINATNARGKVMKYAAEKGIVPLSVQKDRLSLEKVRSDMAKAAKGGDDPAAVREYNYYKSLSPDEQKKYLSVKRASPDETFEKERQKKKGAAQGEAENDLADMQSSFPELSKVVDNLHELGKMATYTKAGRFIDAVGRQFDVEPRESAIAREKYINTVRDQVLPLLRQTFGAAFTVKEGDTLIATLGDPNKSPPEKDAALDAFIAQKERDITSKKRRVGGGDENTNQPPKRLKYNPTTGDFE